MSTKDRSIERSCSALENDRHLSNVLVITALQDAVHVDPSPLNGAVEAHDWVRLDRGRHESGTTRALRRASTSFRAS